MIAPDDIIFIEKQAKYSLDHTKNNIYKTYQTMGEFEGNLGSSFLRVHRAFIVNLGNISSIKEFSNRSYEINFDGYNKTALMSRYKYEEHKYNFTPL